MELAAKKTNSVDGDVSLMVKVLERGDDIYSWVPLSTNTDTATCERGMNVVVGLLVVRYQSCIN